MKVAIVVYSLTGHTKSVAERIKSRLVLEGHNVDYLPITHEPKKDINNPMEKPIFSSLPYLGGYDAYIFGAFTEAFNLSRVMQAYLSQLDKSDKKAVCLTTQHLMKSWLGGNAAQKKMAGLLAEKGYEVAGGANVNWKTDEGREERIEKAVSKICELIK